MISDLLQLDGCEPGLGLKRAENKAEVMRLESLIRVYQNVLGRTRDRQWAKTLRKAIKITHYDQLQLQEAA